MKKHKSQSIPAFLRYLIAAGSAILFSVAAAVILALSLLKSDDPTANLSLYGEIIFSLSMLICGFVGAKSVSEGRFLSGMLSCALMLLTVICLSAALSGLSFPKSGILCAIGLACSVLGSLLGAREKRRKRKST